MKIIMKRNIRTVLRLIVIVVLLPSTMMVTRSQTTFAASSDPQAYVNLTEEQRAQVAKNMTQNEKEIIMNEFSKQNATVNENMNEIKMTNDTMTLMGNFVDAGDGFHKAEGIAKVINLADGRTFLRLENLKTTNGPDLYVYLSVGKDALDIVNLGRLKGNIGNQNYEIPAGTDLSKYNTALIWCKAFSTLFGSSKLSS
jgi:Electron transfer DM13.